MNKPGLAGFGFGALALVLALVNISRVSSALQRLEGLHASPDGPGAAKGEDGKAAPLTDEERRAEIDWLKRETTRIKTEVEKARAEIAARTSGTGTGTDPTSTNPPVFTAADVDAEVERHLQARFENQKLQEAEAKIAVLERNAANEMRNLENRLNLEPAEKARLEAILKAQVEGYGAVLRKFPVPADKQAQLDKVTTDSEAQILQALGTTKGEIYKKSGGNWHGLGGKADPKSDRTPPGPRK